MKHLIIYAHPNDQSLNNHFKKTVVEVLQNAGHEIEVRDLYRINFNPVLSLEDMKGQRMGAVDAGVQKEQAFISRADHITFIYPIWWTGMPAILKGYIDRVFSYGFAYEYNAGVQKGLLNGRQAVIINTHGKSAAEYAGIGMDKALLLTSDKGIYSYCGLDVKQHFFFDRADRAESECIENWTKQVVSAFDNPDTNTF
ncbi:MAG: NAD(P)H-dependent oxidoreductase [Sphingobacteriia bacterium]|nr:NAD(P)H-dependent oxidoreductase [Sphingobacteriia bacterium]